MTAPPAAATTPLTAQDRRNQATWATPDALQELDDNAAYTDPGELAAHVHVEARARGRPILDLGVGMGRTIPLLEPWTDDYLAIDYLPAMVRTARDRFPHARIEVGDARDLSGCQDGHFGLVQFSYNGLDAVAARDRPLVLRAVRRVLAPGGLFLFSALNLDGPGYRERPWDVRLPRAAGPLRLAWSLARAARWAPVHVVRWLRLQPLCERGPGYAVAPLSAHHWGIAAHFTTLARQLEELEREGFEPDPAVFDSRSGARVAPGSTSHADWFHFVAQRRA